MNLQNRERLTDFENELMVVEGGGRASSGVWDGHVHTAVLKVNNQQGLTELHRDPAQCYVAARMEGSLGENGYLCTYG